MTLSVRVQPRARRPGLCGRADGPDGPVLLVRVAEPPADGRANAAVAATLAAALGVAKRDVALLAGAAGRAKRFRIAGDPAALIARLAAL